MAIGVAEALADGLGTVATWQVDDPLGHGVALTPPVPPVEGVGLVLGLGVAVGVGDADGVAVGVSVGVGVALPWAIVTVPGVQDDKTFSLN